MGIKPGTSGTAVRCVKLTAKLTHASGFLSSIFSFVVNPILNYNNDYNLNTLYCEPLFIMFNGTVTENTPLHLGETCRPQCRSLLQSCYTVVTYMTHKDYP